MNRKTFYVIIYLSIFIVTILVLKSCKQTNYPTPAGYRVYVTDTDLIYIDEVSGKVIYKETFNWEKPTSLQQAIINDNK